MDNEYGTCVICGNDLATNEDEPEVDNETGTEIFLECSVGFYEDCTAEWFKKSEIIG